MRDTRTIATQTPADTFPGLALACESVDTAPMVFSTTRLPRLLAVAVCWVAPASGFGGDSPPWRMFGGGVHFRWHTQGRHGHFEECRERSCNDEDWRRRNLDNSLGLRLGIERLWKHSALLSGTAGWELNLLASEYNLSQRDVFIGGTFATAGVLVGGERGDLVAQAGLGGFATNDGRGGAAGFLEAGGEAGVSSTTRVRLAGRRTWLAGRCVDEASLTLRASPDSAPADRWQVGVGVSRPGLGGGRDAGLGNGAVWQLAVGRPVGGGDGRAGVLLGAAGREARRESNYGTVSGNQRGREVWEVGGWWDERLAAGESWELRAGATVRLAHWSDDGPLLRRPSGDPRSADVAGGLGVTLAAGRHIGDGLRVEAVVEPVVWPTLELVELRARVGFAAGQAAGSIARAPRRAPCQALLCDWGRDLGTLALRPVHLDGRDWRALGLAALAVGGVAVFDEPIRDAVQRRSSVSSRDAAEAFRPVSNWGPAAGIALVWAGARLAADERTEAAAADALETVLLTGLVVVPTVKWVSGRARPAANLGAAHLRPFSGLASFPSGEVAQAFALATAARQHGATAWLEGALWAFAGAATWSRLELDRHWASDAVAGALVGVAMGRWVAAGAAVRRGGSQATVTPVAVAGGVAVAVRVAW